MANPLKQRTQYDCVLCCIGYYLGFYPDIPCPAEWWYTKNWRGADLYYMNKGLKKYKKRLARVVDRETYKNAYYEFQRRRIPTTFNDKGDIITILFNNTKYKFGAHAVIMKGESLIFDPNNSIVPTRISFDLKSTLNYKWLLENI
jgi:hypothetical protein